MDIFLHNTQTGRKEAFAPSVPGEVSVYVCGPTVYDLVHVGNGLSAVAFDVLARLLRAAYPRVKYVRNVTDVDDKINAAAKRVKEPIGELAARFAEEYRKDMAALGVLDPDVEPRATEHIGPIVAMIEALIARGHAYQAEGHLLFHVPSDPAYGSLTKRSLDEMRDGARVEVAPYKRDPKDFVLWKPSTPDLPGWESPWGRGRPGWHIECSAMIREHLGPVIDIHGGGSDLAFPHHENESAQSRCANQVARSVRYWLHNGMLTMRSGKMSKSVGNIVTVRDLLRRHHGETLRYALMSGHYRQGLEWSDALLAQAKASLDRLYQALRDGDGEETASAFSALRLAAFPASVAEALCDDLNTPRALAALHALASEAHRAANAAARAEARRRLLAGGWLLGLLDRPPREHFQSAALHLEEEVHLTDTIETIKGRDARVDQLIAERAEARAARDFDRADDIRAKLAEMGVELQDGRDGTTWKISARART